VADTVYYCEIQGDYTPEFPKGIIMIPFRREYFTKINRCVSYSHKVWKQGPKGGVKIIKDKMGTDFYGYVTKNEKAIQQFMWVKLQAQPLANYT
jgi:hypothetical protein